MPPITNFETLRQEGLDIIRQLSGNQWTDHNLHDPGITLLEALCYALTDLEYRAALPIPNLFGGETYQEQFKTATEILPLQKPVTLNDYRRRLIGIKGVQNAWALANKDTKSICLHLALEPDISLHEDLNALEVQAELPAPPGDTDTWTFRTRFTITNLTDWETLANHPDENISFDTYTLHIHDETHHYFSETQLPQPKAGMVHHRYRIQFENNQIPSPRNRIEMVADCMEEQQPYANDRYDINQAGGIENSFMIYAYSAGHTRLSKHNSTNNLGFWFTIADENAQIPYQENSRFYCALFHFLNNPDKITELCEKINNKKKAQTAIIDKAVTISENWEQVNNHQPPFSPLFTWLMQTQEIALHATITLKPGSNAEEVQQQIMYHLNQYMCPVPTMQSYQYMLDRDSTPDALLESNYDAEKGYLPDDQLHNAETYLPHLYPTRVQDLLLTKIPAIAAIGNLRLVLYIDGLCEAQTALLTGETADKANKHRLPYLTLLRHAHYKLRLPRASALLSELHFQETNKEACNPPFRLWNIDILQYAQALREKVKVNPCDNRFLTPPPDYPDSDQLTDYYSIQNHLPLVYGAGNVGLLPTEPPARHAQVKQLKAYLVFFEQLMLDYLNRLGMVKEYLKQKPQNEMPAFENQFNVIEKIPHGKTLMEDPEKDKYESHLVFHTNLYHYLTEALSVSENEIFGTINSTNKQFYECLLDGIKEKLNDYLFAADEAGKNYLDKFIRTTIDRHLKCVHQPEDAKKVVTNSIKQLQDILPQLIFSHPDKVKTQKDRFQKHINAITGEPINKPA
ncbi:hypothetical protein C7N43_26015 [Sphingobacteriales bacterium UPWRP_1]|nr:hypothetical protein BVG80_17820 [Sphingobacteriales bacterium TSM_CSM]PSJ74052.1 hypothetical protein C7N43_26015 [Sphingobacteriales bacterium UPWRP_1]